MRGRLISRPCAGIPHIHECSEQCWWPMQGVGAGTCQKQAPGHYWPKAGANSEIACPFNSCHAPSTLSTVNSFCSFSKGGQSAKDLQAITVLPWKYQENETEQWVVLVVCSCSELLGNYISLSRSHLASTPFWGKFMLKWILWPIMNLHSCRWQRRAQPHIVMCCFVKSWQDG